MASNNGFVQNQGESGSSQVPFPPLLENELVDIVVEQFLTSLRFEQRGKLD
jgi:hypothetical protein